MENREGQQLGNYHLLRLIGQGGFADVYLGRHLHLNTQAAIKILQMRLVGSNLEQFRTEAQAIASLVHPHIIRVLDFGLEDGVPFLVMDYAPGDTLRTRHPKGTRLPLALVVSYVKQIADALQYAHDKRLIHRDVKPENMLVGQNDEILLSDFGLVLIAQSSGSRSTKEIAGTVPYMAPEQIQGRPRTASDQYALGIIAYEWLTGTPPFQGSALEMYGQHLFAAPVSLREHDPDIPSVVEAVILKALAKDPQQRFADVRAFATALEEAYQLTKYDAVELSTVIPAQDQSSPSITVKTPPEAATEPTLVNTPSANVTDPVLIDIPLVSATEPTFVNTPSADVTEPTIINTPSEAATEPTFVNTPSADVTDPTFINTPSAEATELTVVNSPRNAAVEPTAIVASPEAATEPTIIQTPAPLLLELDAVPADVVLATRQLSPVLFDEELTEEIPPTGVSVSQESTSAAVRPGKTRWMLAGALVLLVLLLIFGSIAYALSRGHSVFAGLPFSRGNGPANAGATFNGSGSLVYASSAIVTITPKSKDVQNTYTIAAVTGSPNTSAHQVQARQLSSTSAQTETVQATGTGTSAATHASGVLTLYNYNKSSSVTLAAGTSIANMQSVSVNMVLTGSVTAPAATDPSNPTPYYVDAYVAQAGTIGNLPPVTNGDAGFYYCSGCSNGNVTGWEIENDTAFSGGKNAQTVTEVQQSDIDNAAAQLRNVLTPNVENAVQGQVRANERSINATQCSSQTSSNHVAGDQVSSFTLTERETCSAEVYDYDGALMTATQWLQQDAAKTPGPGYALVGNIVTNELQASGQGNLAIVVSAEGVWAFQFSTTQKQALTKLIVGKDKRDAQSLLSQQRGVAMVNIQFPANDGNSLPTDLSQIKLVVQGVKGN